MERSWANGTGHAAAKARRPPIEKMKVLYIAGWGRSGSTILGRLMGQVEGFFSVGELRYIWDRGLIQDRLCGCGVPFHECPIWREVLRQMLDVDEGFSAQEMVDLRERGMRTRHILLAPTRGSLQARVAHRKKYLETLEHLYETVQVVSGGRVLVDTSKFPSYGYALENTPGIELYVLHLVRDPRAVAYSWGTRRKPKLDRIGEPSSVMTSHGLVKSSLVWDQWNAAVERVWRATPERYMLLRYEDFVKRPRSAVEDILRFLGEGTLKIPFEDEKTVSLETSHAFSGNPDRFKNGAIAVEADEEWRRSMSPALQAAVAALTWPGLLRYGYPLLPQRNPAREG